MARGQGVIDALVSEDTQKDLNQNPYFQFGVLFLLFAVGSYLQVKGLKGLKEGTITGKYGKVYTGKTAKVYSIIYMAVGFAVDITCIVLLLQNFAL